MREYFEAGFSAAVSQMVVGVLGFVFLAYLLYLVGTRLKESEKRLFGKVERVISVPGEFFRNMGVSVACMLTGTKVRRHLFRDDKTGDASSVTHSRLDAGTPISFLRTFVILTAPIWFGSLILMIFVLVAGGTGIMPHVKDIFADGDVGLLQYATSVFLESLSMLSSLVCVWHWTSPFCLFVMICFISIATEISISTLDIWAIKTGLFGVFVLLIILNAIPGMTQAFAAIGKTVRPALFTLHVVMLFVVFVDFLAFLILGALAKIFHCKR